MQFRTVMVALVVQDDESAVISAAVQIADKYQAKLIAIHVNEPHAGEMSMMMDSVGPKITEENIRDSFRTCGFEDIAEKIEVRILSSKSIPKAIAEETKSVDLLVLGHRRMSTFKANFFDSVDEGIVNNMHCPVLVVPK